MEQETLKKIVAALEKMIELMEGMNNRLREVERQQKQ